MRNSSLTVTVNVFLVAVLIALVIVVIALRADKASAHEWCCTSSVNGNNILWRSSTIYRGARNHGIRQWNSLSGRPNFVYDSYPQFQNHLSFVDYWANDGQDGVTYIRAGVDLVRFNKRYMRYHSIYDRQAVAVHEQGHTLKLWHPPRSIKFNNFWRKTSIMYRCASCTPFNKPARHDINDFYYIW